MGSDLFRTDRKYPLQCNYCVTRFKVIKRSVAYNVMHSVINREMCRRGYLVNTEMLKARKKRIGRGKGRRTLSARREERATGLMNQGRPKGSEQTSLICTQNPAG